MRAVLPAIFVLLCVGCSFDDAAETCRANGRCASDAGEPVTDGGDGPEDGGDTPDGGDGPDGGTPACDEDFAVLGALCRDGWCWQHPLPHGSPMRAVHGRGDVVYAAGDHGTVLQVRGCEVRAFSVTTAQPVPPEESHAVALHVRRSGAVTVALGAGIVSSGDSAQSWEDVSSRRVSALWEGPDSVLLQGTPGGPIFAEGENTPRYGGVGAVHRLAEDSVGPLALTAEGVVRGGDNWSLRLPLPTSAPRQGLTVLPDDVLVYARPAGELSRYTFGALPQAVVPPSAFTLPDGGIQDLISVAPFAEGALVVGTAQGALLAVGADGGVGPVGALKQPAPVPDLFAASEALVFGASEGGLLAIRRGEGGSSGERGRVELLERRALGQAVQLSAIAGDGERAWAVGGDTVYCTDGGAWSVCATAPSGVTLHAVAVFKDVVVVGGGDYLAWLGPGGALVPIIPINSLGLPGVEPGWYIRSLVVNDERLLAAGSQNGSNGGTWASLDGKSFTEVPDAASPSPLAVVFPIGPDGAWGVSENAYLSVAAADGSTGASSSLAACQSCTVTGLWAENDQTSWLATSKGPFRCTPTEDDITCTPLQTPTGDNPRGDFYGVTKVGADVVFFSTIRSPNLPDSSAAWKVVTNGGTWQVEERSAPPAANLRAVFRAPSGHVWAAGDRGAVLKWTPP